MDGFPGSPAVRQAEELALRGRWADAAALYSHLLAAAPEDPRLLCGLSGCMGRLGRPADALRLAERAAAIAPGSEWAHRLRSIHLLATGRWTAAERAAEDAVRAGPHSAPALLTLFRARFARRDRRGTAELAQALVEQFPDDADAHDALGLAWMLASDWRRAEDALRRALALRPGSAVVVSHLALSLERQRRHREALDAFRLAASTDPADEDVRDELVGAVERWLTIRMPAAALALAVGLCLLVGRMVPLAGGVTVGLVAATATAGAGAIGALRWWRHHQLDENLRLLLDARWLRHRVHAPPYPVFFVYLCATGLAALATAGWYTHFNVNVVLPAAVFLLVVLPFEGPALWRRMLRQMIRGRAAAAAGSTRG